VGDADDKKDKPEPPSKDGQWGAEAAGKQGYEDKKFERGVGNRKPEKPPEGESKREIGFGPIYKQAHRVLPALSRASRNTAAR
jgi:hypothetical protein